MKTLPDAVVGAFWMLVSAVCYVASATILRGLGDAYSPYELTFIRSLIATAIILPIFLYQGAKITLIPPRFTMHLAVAGFSYLGILFWFQAASILPVADFFALQFTTPLFTIALAILFLRERADLASWIATFVGFAGVLIVLRPGVVEVSIGAIAALLSSVGYASVNTVIKSLSRTTSPTIIVFYGNLLLAPLSLPMAFVDWRTPLLQDWPAILAVSVLSTFGYLTITKGITLAPARVIQPVNFMRMPLAAVAGWIFFTELPDMWTWAGAIVIFASTTYAVGRGARRGEKETTSKSKP
jgi:drug/metabolite transporter (DMT)-like permease